MFFPHSSNWRYELNKWETDMTSQGHVTTASLKQAHKEDLIERYFLSAYMSKSSVHPSLKLLTVNWGTLNRMMLNIAHDQTNRHRVINNAGLTLGGGWLLADWSVIARWSLVRIYGSYLHPTVLYPSMSMKILYVTCDVQIKEYKGLCVSGRWGGSEIAWDTTIQEERRLAMFQGIVTLFQISIHN